jgi:hypothetical protein
MRIITHMVSLVCLLLLTSAIIANDENLPDSLIIEEINYENNAKMAVNINFVNDQELAALTIPLAIVGKGIGIDSVSFAGSRVEYLKMRPVTIAKEKREVVFGAIVMTEEYIPPGKGLLATLYLSSDSTKSSGCIIDTTTIGPASVLFTKISSASFVPSFRAGSVSVVEAPRKKE